MFKITPRNRRAYRAQNRMRLVFGAMTVLLVIPILLILGVLIARGGSAVSFEFLFGEPTDNMTAGGIFPALVGTVWLVTVALRTYLRRRKKW